MRRTRARGDLHGAVEGQKNCKAYLRCAGFCPAVRRQAHNLRPHPESSPYVRHSREFADDAAGPNRLDGGEIFEAVTVEFFFFSFWPPPFQVFKRKEQQL